MPIAVLLAGHSNFGKSRTLVNLREKPVKAIAEGVEYGSSKGAFQSQNIVAIQLPASITYIGGGAFSDNELTSVTIPDSVTYLNGFSNNQLTSVTIDNGVTYISAMAFYNNLQEVYNNNGKKAGRYTSKNYSWEYSEK